jgi:hypothetical protein
MVQLVTRTKRKVAEVMEIFPFEMSGPQLALNILPPGSYDVLIGMD